MQETSTYFGGGNTEAGFVNYFHTLVEKTDRLYILKGGCGCGKNSLMKRVAAAAEDKGFKTERILCASDPNSLDGVLIPEKGVGVVDGTPPHELSPRLPGAMDNLVDLGEYWDNTRLRKRLEEIKALTAEKKGCYDRAYGMLGGKGRLRRERLCLTEKALLYHKLKAAAGRYADKLCKRGDSFGARLCPVYAFCGEGEKRAEAEQGELWQLDDGYGIAPVFLAALVKGLKERGVSFIYAPDATAAGALAAVTAQAAGVVIARADKASPCHVINMERFVDKGVIAAYRQRLRFLAKAEEAIKENARLCLAEAREKHLALEEIYTPCMDFTRVNKRAKQLIKEMLA